MVALCQESNDGLRNEWLIPQLFTSVPALNDAASYLAETTSYITRCFGDFSGSCLSLSLSQVFGFVVMGP